MWLTGFDAPCLHTMYADKPMQGHGLMQAIARVNRVFRDKPGGLVVDYLGLADQLKKALITYTESGGQGDPTFDTAQAIAVMLEKQNLKGVAVIPRNPGHLCLVDDIHILAVEGFHVFSGVLLDRSGTEPADGSDMAWPMWEA